MAELIQVHDRFVRGPKDGRKDLDLGDTINKAYEDDMKQMERLAFMLNSKQVPIKLTFYGNVKKGLFFEVECEDAETKEKVDKVLNKYKADQDDLFNF
ncbi:hypothetical protein DYU11_18395 [Fibrisoma montanum]|uniref:Uncharacterized protein n=1 Tax=Fibrisoma montanum TaxID=2305895 RepID=A0A418M627_9BACT|nr:hypothetical protein [Fibrisoma montanum]RIV21377.1 hypothetical protein DYU11_18395 [Fibrisoma montanum]